MIRVKLLLAGLLSIMATALGCSTQDKPTLKAETAGEPIQEIATPTKPIKEVPVTDSRKEVPPTTDKPIQKPAAAGNSGAELSPDQFAKLQKLIKPAPGESRWEEIPWLLSVYDAQKRAAEEGKPILIWSGGGSPPIGGC